MRLLITTQALDTNDPILGFFVRWVEEFAKHTESVTVICLRKGEYTLPENVRVFALGGGNKLTRTYKLLRGAYMFRQNYDAVFVHMNPEYLVAAGWLWRMLGKRMVLWYTHKSVNVRLRVAAHFAGAILTASKESFRLPSPKLNVMGHGIDTSYFSPSPDVPREAWWVSVGRLTLSKRHDLAIRAAHEAGQEIRIAGDGPERKNLETLAHDLGARVVFLGGLTHEGVRDAFRQAALFYHTSETGSLDKVVLEAIACGCPVKTLDPALKFMESKGPEYVREEHSLSALIPRILKVLNG